VVPWLLLWLTVPFVFFVVVVECDGRVHSPPPQKDVYTMRRHLEGMLNVCFDRDFNQRPSASDLLEHAYILSAPADHLMRQGSFESVNGEDGEDGENGEGDDIFGSGSWGTNRSGRSGGSGGGHKTDDVEAIGLRVNSNYDDDGEDSLDKERASLGESAWLGTGLLESKTSMTSDVALLVRQKSIAMNNNVQSYLNEKADNFERTFSETFRKDDDKTMGTPPVSRPKGKGGFFEESDEEDDNPFGSGNNPFASSSDMFDKTFSSE
jgi:hypothetical protein